VPHDTTSDTGTAPGTVNRIFVHLYPVSDALQPLTLGVRDQSLGRRTDVQERIATIASAGNQDQFLAALPFVVVTLTVPVTFIVMQTSKSF
jgi:hypothetical protein